MIQCPKCLTENSPDSSFCKSCAEPLSSLSQMPTMAAPEAESPPALVQSPHVGRIVSSDSVPAGGFTPGTVLADRYRIIGLLGRGGMGEVYRADDLKLGQPVALKFLPPKLAEDPVRRERFFAEVRITRQLSHPNICRVYDIGDVDKRHFLSMEYIDGEDLASLMKRIGHLSNEKALDIARQLIAGLSIAHERGVLHRDLKPANIMLDGHGRVRITDFGLAIAAEDISQAEEIAGTPAYMAPEQLAGKGATVRSDIYSLGLILYEIYTGRKAFTAKTLADLREQKETQTPRAPSEIREEIDPIVQHVIQQCMEKDPTARPASVTQLAQALPGGDPLAAAIAAGETPSPEMVATSGSKEGLKPWIAWTCLIFTLLGMGAAVMMKRQVALYERVPIQLSPELMEAKAREILKNIGYPDQAVDSMFGFEPDYAYLDYIEATDQSPDRFEDLLPSTIQFWYRQSPGPLWTSGQLEPENIIYPPLIERGDCIVFLDSRGDLVSLQIIPPEAEEHSETVIIPDWAPLFKAAGLDEKDFTPVEPDGIYLAYADTRAAWTGKLSGLPGTEIGIEAAAWQGKPVLWRLIMPYQEFGSFAFSPPAIIAFIIIIVVLLCFLAVVLLARRNLRMGRGDRCGANRFAYFIFSLGILSWIFSKHHVWDPSEILNFLSSTSFFLFIAGLIWLMYIALEPFVRRHWPVVLIGWNRLLTGNWRDPVVGRDLLVGSVVGMLGLTLGYLQHPLSSMVGEPQIRPFIDGHVTSLMVGLEMFKGTGAIIGKILSVIIATTSISLFFGFFLFLVRLLTRRTWIAIVLFILIGTALIPMFGRGWSIYPYISLALLFAAQIYIFFRFGFLAWTAARSSLVLLAIFPITTQVNAWYFHLGITGLILLLAFVFYAFYTSLGGRPMFGTPRLDE